MTVLIISIAVVFSALLLYGICALSSQISREQELYEEFDRWEQASEEEK